MPLVFVKDHRLCEGFGMQLAFSVAVLKRLPDFPL